MKIITSVQSMQKTCQQAKQKQIRIGFNPTMGCLHEGHFSLIRQSKKENDLTVLSIFVNPTQFGPDEDYQKYPRNKKHDELLAKKEKVDIIFYPSESTMYPSGYLTYVNVEAVTKILCGKFRPKHFLGVTTIVAKLCNIIAPDVIYLGQKDAQQAFVIKQMIRDLNWPIKAKIMPIIREHDGLAMSSRNKYLTQQERKQATCLYQSLLHAKKMIAEGERNPRNIVSKIKHIIGKGSKAKIQYIECLNASTLTYEKILKEKTLIALATFYGKTRLIDNIIISA